MAEEKRFGQDIWLVVRRVFLADTIVAAPGDVGQCSVEDAGDKLARLRHAAQFIGVDQPGQMLIEDVTWPDFFGVRSGEALVFWAECRRESIDERAAFRRASWIAGGAAEAGQARDVLAQRMARHKSIAAVPASHRRSRG